tara:strand:- start:220 stop:795 length:576 start_codon:yes stop_codon:yes gene_type:complete
MKNKLKFALIYGSTRKKRLGIRFVNYLSNQILKNKHTPMIIDPLENKLPLLDKRYEDFSKNKLPKSVKNIHEILNKADAIILISAEYNHMPPPALINLLNYFYTEFNRKPSSICTYSVGDFAGVRVQGPLRTLMTQLGSPPIKFGMFQGRISKSFDEKGIPSNLKDTEERFNLFFKELLWYAKALKAERKF